jgi:hypothetical protein
MQNPGKEFEKEWENMKENGGQLSAILPRKKAQDSSAFIASGFCK